MTAATHLLIGIPLIVAACFVQLIPDSFFPRYGERFYSRDTIRWAKVVRREGIRFILLLPGIMQTLAGIRDW
jgi:hypothetical protein